MNGTDLIAIFPFLFVGGTVTIVTWQESTQW
jgi:hypothetical protein